MGVHVFPVLNPPSYLPLHPIPQVHPSAPALSTLSHALNLDWQSLSHMIKYMFQCYSLKSIQPHLLLQSPKNCSIHLYLFCCLTYRVIVTIFLNSIYIYIYIYVSILYWWFSFWLTSLYMAIHSRTLAWKIPWREEPDRLQSTGTQKVRHDFTFTFTLYNRFQIHPLSAWWTMDGGSWHCTGDRDQDHPHGKEMHINYEFSYEKL